MIKFLHWLYRDELDIRYLKELSVAVPCGVGVVFLLTWGLEVWSRL